MESTENLYQILGVAEDAAEEELKTAYRKLAKKYHPDAHPGDKECEKMFQAVSEAYRVLSSPQKRKEYDAQCSRQTERSRAGQNQKAAGQNQNSKSSGVDFENIHRTFEQFFGFDPNSKDVTNEKKRNPGTVNPLDTTDLFERFMGIKR